jgi:hypothetical protein
MPCIERSIRSADQNCTPASHVLCVSCRRLAGSARRWSLGLTTPSRHSVRWRERLGGMTYAWSVECPLNDQGLVRLLVTAAGEAVVMCDSGESGSGRRTPAGVAPGHPRGPRLARVTRPFRYPRDHRAGGHGRRKILTRCRIGLPPFVETVEGGRRGPARQRRRYDRVPHLLQ